MVRDRLRLFLVTCHPDKVAAILKEHLSLGFPVTVLDGSAGDALAPEEEACGAHWLRMPGSPISERLLAGLEQCQQPYVAVLSDDDHFVGSTLAACVEQLEAHPEYVAAHGLFWVGDTNAAVLEEYSPSLESADASERVHRQLCYYSHVSYAVQRREAMVRSVENGAAFWDYGCFYELAQSVTLVAQGRVKRLMQPHALRCAVTPAEAEAKYRQHPLSWEEKEPAEFARAREYFVTTLARMEPFCGWKDARSALESSLGAYLDNVSFERNIPLRHRYLAMILHALNPHSDPLDAIGKMDREQQEYLYETLHPALESMFRLGEQLGLPREWLPSAATVGGPANLDVVGEGA